MSIIAFRILFISNYQKDKNVDVDKVFSSDEITAIRIKGKIRKNKKLGVKDAVIIVAKMGGFFGRKSDAAPGFITIWRGMKKLSEIIETINMIKK